MVAHQQKKGFIASITSRTVDSMSVAQRGRLFDEAHSSRVITGGGSEGRLGARVDNDGDFFDASLRNLLDQDGQGGFGNTIAVNESLKWENLLGFASGGDDGFANVHVGQFDPA